MLSNLLRYKKFMLQNKKKQKAILGILLKKNVNEKIIERKSNKEKEKKKIELILTYNYYLLF